MRSGNGGQIERRGLRFRFCTKSGTERRESRAKKIIQEIALKNFGLKVPVLPGKFSGN